jgi:Outer membrane protein beta-barrel domain
MTFKSNLLALTFLLFSKCLFAQSSYISINAGYGWNASSGNISGIENATYSSNSNTLTDLTPINEEQINISLGKGSNFGLTAGYMLNTIIGAEIGISMLKGDVTSSKSTIVSNSTIINYNNDLSADMLRFNPSIVINAGMSQFNPYMKFGLIYGSGDITKKVSFLEGTHNYAMNYVYNGGWSVGTTASIGVLYTVDKQISCFCELTMINMSYAPTNGEITLDNENGVDNLPNMNINDKKIVFKDSYTTQGQSASTSEPSIGLSHRYPFGSLGLNIGLKYNL